MLKLNRSKLFLERFHDLVNKKHTGTNVFAELAELGDMVQEALDEIYQAEQDAARANSPLRRLEAMGQLRAVRMDRRHGA